MSHVDPEILALLALGETAEHPGDDGHLPGCAACQQDLGELSGIVSLARTADADHWLTDPPPDLWPRIAAEVGLDLDLDAGHVTDLSSASSGADPAGETPAAPPAALPGITRPAGHPPTGSSRRTGRPWWQRSVAAVVAALIVGAGAAFGIQHYRSGPPPTVIGRFELRPLARFPQWKDTGGSAVLERNASGQSLKVTLRAPVRHGFYEVWLLARDGVKMISLGDLSSGHAGTFTLPPGVDLGVYTRVDISLQAFNGNPAHSASSVVRGTLP